MAIRKNWKRCLILLIASLSLIGASAFKGCSSTPVWNGKIYAGNSDGYILWKGNENQNNDKIITTDPRFNEYGCIKYEDIGALAEIIKSCKQW